MKFEVYTTEEFDKLFSKLDPEIQRQIGKEIDQLEDNPFTGKPLGYNFFREKKIQAYRVYYLIYETYLIVFIVTISGKKYQQKAIDKIKKLLPYYRKLIKEKLNL